MWFLQDVLHHSKTLVVCALFCDLSSEEDRLALFKNVRRRVPEDAVRRLAREPDRVVVDASKRPVGDDGYLHVCLSESDARPEIHLLQAFQPIG